jgi:hypothetical protein
VDELNPPAGLSSWPTLTRGSCAVHAARSTRTCCAG